MGLGGLQTVPSPAIGTYSPLQSSSYCEQPPICTGQNQSHPQMSPLGPPPPSQRAGHATPALKDLDSTFMSTPTANHPTWLLAVCSSLLPALLASALTPSSSQSTRMTQWPLTAWRVKSVFYSGFLCPACGRGSVSGSHFSPLAERVSTV